jgi:hypothetical protein
VRPASVVDHLVVAAATLDQGVQWCEATFGITPGAGGSHSLMGTHNRMVRLDGPHCSHCYLEIIAIEPGAPAPAMARWFDLDQAGLRAAHAAIGLQGVGVREGEADLVATFAAPSGRVTLHAAGA